MTAAQPPLPHLACHNATALAILAHTLQDDDAAGVACDTCGAPMNYSSLAQVETPVMGLRAAPVACTAPGCVGRGLKFLT